MTTIIAVETKRGVLMGADTQVSSYRKDELAEGKLFQNGDYAFGVAGRARLMQELKYASLPEPDRTDLDRFMKTTFLQAIKNTVKEAGIKDGESEIIVAVLGKVFMYRVDYTVFRNASGIYITGSGSTWAEGVLAGLDKIRMRDVELALKAAAKNDLYTSGPFTLLDLTK